MTQLAKVDYIFNKYFEGEFLGDEFLSFFCVVRTRGKEKKKKEKHQYFSPMTIAAVDASQAKITQSKITHSDK